MTFLEFFLLVAVGGLTGVGASTALSSMIDRIGRSPTPHRSSRSEG